MKAVKDGTKNVIAWWIGLGMTVQIAVVGVLGIALIGVVAFTFLSGNNYDSEPSVAEAPIATPTPSPTPTPTPPPPVEEEDEEDEEYVFVDPRPVSILTGLHLEEEDAVRRPLAVVINNYVRALPQSGVAQADIIYEVLVEGDITRYVAIFHSYIPEKIGPVRSTRENFIDFALNHDALFIHHGGSPAGYTRIRTLGASALDGMRLEGTVFWRDRTFPEWTGLTGRRALEHSSYTSLTRIQNHVETTDIRDYFSVNHPSYGFDFGEVPDNIRSLGSADMVSVPFSRGSITSFVFDSETGLYLVENRHGPVIDANNREQVAVANILIQSVPIRVVDGAGRRSVETVGEGVGYLVRDGAYHAVSWIRESLEEPMRWYFEDRTPVLLKPGMTWICVLQTQAQPEFFEAEPDEDVSDIATVGEGA